MGINLQPHLIILKATIKGLAIYVLKYKEKKSLSYSYEQVKGIIEVKSQSGCKLLSKDYIDVKSKLELQCKCGEVFKTSFDNFKNKNKCRCDKCSGKQSMGEIKIERWLIQNKYFYKRQYRFKNCKYKKPLPFDFAILDNNNNLKMLIEYDGEQHFNPYRFKDNAVFEYKKLKTVKERDEIKNKYCKQHNIKLLRIPYTELKNIEKILKSVVV